MRKLIALLALISGSAMAADTAPTAAQAGKSFEPQVTTVQRANETVDEYRAGNHLYMIKVTRNGASYYLVDTDGDGKLDKRRNELDPQSQVPSWVVSQS